MHRGMTPTPDSGFVKDLKTFDPKLEISFDRRFDAFVITQPSQVSGRVPALVISGDNGSGYRQPNQSDIRALYKGDFERNGGKRHVLQEEERFKKQDEDHNKFVKDEIMHQTRDNKRQLINTYAKAFNVGKGVTGFRQVPIKSKGYKVVDRRTIK